MREATGTGNTFVNNKYISIHASREGGDSAIKKEVAMSEISIHASREGGDSRRSGRRVLLQNISIHASREGGDPVPDRI